MLKKLPLHTQILLALGLGLVWGLISVSLGFTPIITTQYIKPFGTIFVNLLKLIALPLVLSSLIVGVSSLSDLNKLSRIGGKTIGIYLCTTVIAISLGLTCVNLLKPGKKLPVETRKELMSTFNKNVESSAKGAETVKKSGPLQPLVDIVPSNFIAAASDNRMMLQIVFFALLMGIALIQIPTNKSEPVVRFFDGLNDVIIKIVDYIMVIAPIGVFALIASLIVEFAGDDAGKAIDLLFALLWYSATVVTGLIIQMLLIYPSIFKIFTKNLSYVEFFKGIRPALLLAFSTSSSSATLPVTMERCEKHLGVSEEVSSFVLPLGATINMDGTSLYQGVAAVFIAQALNMDLSFADQLMIVLTATLASIGTAGVPGAGMVMLVIVLETIHVPIEGIALIVAVDRILDMIRTMVNVTGDAAVAVVISQTENAT